MSDYLEKLVFLEMTNKEMVLLPTQDYFDTYKKLSESEQKHFEKLAKQIHDIWTEINSKDIQNVKTKIADSIEKYNETIEKVDPIILKCYFDFGITLKRELNPNFKNALIKFLGQEFFDKHFG